MKIILGIFDGVAIVAIGIIFLAGCKTSSTRNADVEKSINGTNLKLVGKYEPLRLYIYADTASTNKLPDYAIFQGHEPVFYRENDSNTVVTTHFENGLDILDTERDDNGHFLRRSFNGYNDNSSKVKCFYVDTNGDNLWDRFVVYGTNAASTRFFVQSNLCWVQIGKGK
jgi:hypothetical protein